MPRTTIVCLMLACSAGLLAAPGVAFAQGQDNEFNKNADDLIASDKQAVGEKNAGDKMPGEKSGKEAPSGPDPMDPREDPSKTYYFVGARFRDVIIPKFIFNIFADGGRTVNVPMGGLEFSSRKNGVEYDIALTYADYSMDEFLFKGKKDGEEAWETVKSDLKLVYATIDLLYEVWADPSGRFSFMVGGGIGIAGVFDGLYRAQVYPNTAPDQTPNPDDPGQWRKCTGAVATPVVGNNGPPYCDASNDHYYNSATDTVYEEVSWASGGSKPFIFPWIGLPQLSFRFKPIKQLHLRADLGFSISGFFFGFAGAYGL